MSLHVANSEPLTIWICDNCGNPIDRIQEGYVVWRLINDKYGGFMIVHQDRCDPGSGQGYTHSLALEDFLGAKGLARLLAWLSLGPLRGPSDDRPRVHDLDEYVDLVRRVQTPYYEEARHRFADEDVQYNLGDANEYAPYLPEVLKGIVDKTPGS
jgi:hypothetical protein